MVVSRAAIAVGNSRRPQTRALVLRAPDRAKAQALWTPVVAAALEISPATMYSQGHVANIRAQKTAPVVTHIISSERPQAMKKKPTKPRVYIEITAICGNGDIDCTIKVSRRRWEAISKGGVYSTSTTYYYEGKRYTAWWGFADGLFSIGGEDGLELVVDAPISELTVQ